MLTALPVMSLTNTEQMQRLSEFFTQNSNQILDVAIFAFLAGFAATTLVVIATFGIFKALGIFNQMSGL